ncbi:MAG: 2-oxoacid:acceptor oxidoreductase subunit alpha, partial [Halobacteriales archaeon]|nr:2-oxoacid:acceptor oxidoreductase subunit alpha [Halobacteriales archaeon]
PRGGAIIYDPTLVQEPIERIPTLDQRVKDDVTAYLTKQGRGATVNDLLQDAASRGVHLFPLDYKGIIADLAKQLNERESNLMIMKNTIAVGASLGVLNADFALLEDGLAYIFKGKKQVIIDQNKIAARKAYDAVAAQAKQFPYTIKKVPVPQGEQRLFLQGTQAVAMGKILAGCKFQTYYPITPASDESEYLESHPETGVVVVQVEDEIAAVCMAVGAALAGTRSSTSTSGPGFGLMAEGIGWAGINEVPLVVINHQRCGPSTGLPTRHEQGDLRFAMGMGHGDYPRIVLAPGDLDECFHQTVDIFNWCDEYQLPGILLPDKNLANNSATIPAFDTSKSRITRGKLATEQDTIAASKNGGYERYKFTEDGISPRGALGQEGGIFWATGDEHTTVGHITEDPVIRDRMMEKRMRKYDLMLERIPADKKVGVYGPANADVSIVGWGSTKGCILDALEVLKAKGITANFLQIKLLSPFPQHEVEAFLKKAKTTMCIEMNYTGQLAELVKARTGHSFAGLVLKYNGRPMTEDEIVHAVEEHVHKKVPKVVLTHGV